MKFSLTEEQEELRGSLRRFLGEKSPEREVRRLMSSDEGFDEAVWQAMARQLGVQGLIIPEEFGGLGYGYVELMVVLEEMGRALQCSPFFSTVALAANLLLSSGDADACRRHLPGIAAGETIATVAIAESAGCWDESGVALQATRAGDSWSLSGEKLYVTDGLTADLVLVVARSGAGVSLFEVTKNALGLAREQLMTLDLTRKQARLEFSATPARLIGQEGEGWPAVARMLDLGDVALAAEQVGGAERVLEMSVDYAGTRIAFGRPIGSFQAIKHKCADMLVQVESARSAEYYATWAAAEGSDELPAAARLAKSYCSEAYLRVAAENIQVHGGMGFTWEHPAHLYFRRAKSSELLFGDPAYQREQLANLVGI